VSDPIGAGVVASLARPGGNITGFLLYEASIAGKWLGMLKEIAPHLTRAALLGNPKGFPYSYFLRIAKAIAPSLGIEIVPAPIANAEDIDRSKLNMASPGNGTLNHVSGELFKMMAGVDMVHVPYRSGGPALTDLIAGQVQVMFPATVSSIEYIRDGRLRALAVTTATRSELLHGSVRAGL
jgi:Tripartite tricarboxylate transporter family receptor/ABC transporter substrate binding protein